MATIYNPILSFLLVILIVILILKLIPGFVFTTETVIFLIIIAVILFLLFRANNYEFMDNVNYAYLPPTTYYSGEEQYHPEEERYYPEEERYHPEEERYHPEEEKYHPEEKCGEHQEELVPIEENGEEEEEEGEEQGPNICPFYPSYKNINAVIGYTTDAQKYQSSNYHGVKNMSSTNLCRKVNLPSSNIPGYYLLNSGKYSEEGVPFTQVKDLICSSKLKDIYNQ